MEKDEEVDIYEGLPNFRYDETLEQLNNHIAKLEAENRELQSKLSKMAEEKNHLKSSCSILNTNISSLLKTAKLEIRRKERTISDLREQLNNHLPEKKKFGLKSRASTMESHHLKKRSRLSPRKDRYSRKDESTPRKLTRRKPEFSSHSTVQVEIVVAPDEKKGSAERVTKENAPSPDLLGSTETTVGERDTKNGRNYEEPPRPPSPALPALECPTLFSARMYKRLYGKDSTNVSFPVAVGLPCNPPSDVAKRPKQVEHPTDLQPNRIVSGPPTSGSVAPPVDTKCPIRKPVPDVALPPSVTEVVPVASQTISPKPFSTKFNKSSDFVAVSTTSRNAKIHLLSKTTLNSTSHLESEVGHSVLPSVHPGNLKNRELKSSYDRSSKAGLLAFCKPPPIQKSADSKSSAVKKESNDEGLISQAPKQSLELSDPRTTVNKANHITVKPSRLPKSLGLPGSIRERGVRKVFAPISNGWNCSQPKAQEAQDQGGCGELKTVPVMSELSVRVEESKILDLKRVSLPESIFGSPVKWADDSSESQKAEGPANSHKSIIYNLFGSPLKGVDSNSSEHPFSVPPAAYEDSSWTSLHLDKQPNKPAGENCSLKENKPTADAKSYENCIRNGASESVFLPPSQSVIRKHVSIFSPLKDSKSVPCHLPDETGSNTGLFFPFRGPKYEDSVLGQFDDTAQFVSALAKVDTKISPLNTPIKSIDESNHTQSVIEKNNADPTSFGEVFKKNVLPELQLSEDSSSSTHQPDSNQLANKCLQIQNPSVSPSSEQLQPSVSSRETPTEEKLTSEEHISTPSITITPPSSVSSLRIIHRPNFASSTIFKANSGVKSWFPDRPANIVTPRKTPRLVSHASRSASPKGVETNVSARVAINDAFIVEQEERVRRWEQDHLYENTIRSSSGSPLKNMNVSPSRKKMDSSTKSSPSKRASSKQISPSKSPRRAELRKNLGIEPSYADLHTTTGGKPLSCGSPQEDKSLPRHSDQISSGPTSLQTTPKILDMIATIKNSSKLAAAEIPEAVSSNKHSNVDESLSDVAVNAKSPSKFALSAANIDPPISSIQHSKPDENLTNFATIKAINRGAHPVSLCPSDPVSVVPTSTSPQVMESDTPKLPVSITSDDSLRNMDRTKCTELSDSPLLTSASEREISSTKLKLAAQNFIKSAARKQPQYHSNISRVSPIDKSAITKPNIKPVTDRQIVQKTSNFKRSSALRPSVSNPDKASVTLPRNLVPPSSLSTKALPLSDSLDTSLKHAQQHNPVVSSSSTVEIPPVPNTTDTSPKLAPTLDCPKIIRRKKTPNFGLSTTSQMLIVQRLSPVTTEKATDTLKTREWKIHEIGLPIKDDKYRMARLQILEEFRKRNAQVGVDVKSKLMEVSKNGDIEEPGSCSVSSIPTSPSAHLPQTKSSVLTLTDGTTLMPNLQHSTPSDLNSAKDGHYDGGSEDHSLGAKDRVTSKLNPKCQLEVEGFTGAEPAGGSLGEVEQSCESKHPEVSPGPKESLRAEHFGSAHCQPTGSSVQDDHSGAKHSDGGAKDCTATNLKPSEVPLKGKILTGANSMPTGDSVQDDLPPGSRSKPPGPLGAKRVVESKYKIASVSPVRTRSFVRKTILLEGHAHRIKPSKTVKKSSSNTRNESDRRPRGSRHSGVSPEGILPDQPAYRNRRHQKPSQADRSPDRGSWPVDRIRKPEEAKRNESQREIRNTVAVRHESSSAPTATSGTASTSPNQPKHIKKKRRAMFGNVSFNQPNEVVLSFDKRVCSFSDSK